MEYLFNFLLGMGCHIVVGYQKRRHLIRPRPRFGETHQALNARVVEQGCVDHMTAQEVNAYIESSRLREKGSKGLQVVLEEHWNH